jgi:hypothetical protein
MLGRKKAVTALVVEMFLNVLAWHSCNQGLEPVQEINETDHMKDFFDKLYSLHSACLLTLRLNAIRCEL